jgi:ferredoxin
MRIVADGSRCAASGQCVLTDPAVFAQGADGTVVLLSESVEPEKLARLNEAIALCPTQALALARDDA